MLLAVLGVIAALGIYSDVAGPAGHAIDRAAAAVLGGARYLVPFALLFGGLALLVPVRARASDDDEDYEDDERPGRGWRLAVGVALTGLSIVGLMYVGHDDRRWRLHTLQRAGGVFGAAVGTIAGRTVVHHKADYWAFTPVAIPGGGVALMVSRTRWDP